MWTCVKCNKQLDDDDELCYFCGEGVNPNYDNIKNEENKTIERKKNWIRRSWITTGDSFQGYRITSYKGPINANVVIGINVFSDFFSGITDILGGRSHSYENKMTKLYNSCFDILTEKADLLKANAIIGLKIDFDEISGKGKSMLMISMIGTAVELQKEEM